MGRMIIEMYFKRCQIFRAEEMSIYRGSNEENSLFFLLILNIYCHLLLALEEESVDI